MASCKDHVQGQCKPVVAHEVKTLKWLIGVPALQPPAAAMTSINRAKSLKPKIISYMSLLQIQYKSAMISRNMMTS